MFCKYGVENLASSNGAGKRLLFEIEDSQILYSSIFNKSKFPMPKWFWESTQQKGPGKKVLSDKGKTHVP